MQQPSTKRVIFKTAVITMAALSLACIMIAVIVFFCFPYRGYKFASDLGAKKTALFYAEQYAKKDNIDGLVYCIELDLELMGDGRSKYATKLIEHTENFFGYDNAYDYFNQLDEYYLTNAPKQSRVGLYSYYEYLVSSNYVARTVAGGSDEMIFRGAPTKLQDIFVSDITAIETAIVYSALSKAISYGKADLDVLITEFGFTEFYYELHASVTPYIAVSLHECEDSLEALFLMRSVINLSQELSAYFLQKQVDASDQWQVFLDYEYNGKGLNEAYTDMFLDYILSEN